MMKNEKLLFTTKWVYQINLILNKTRFPQNTIPYDSIYIKFKRPDKGYLWRGGVGSDCEGHKRSSWDTENCFISCHE